MNEIWIPLLNAYWFVEVAPAEVAKYLSRTYMDYTFEKTIHPWQQPAKYLQKVQKSDPGMIQFETNFDPVTIQIINRYDVIKATLNPSSVRINQYKPGFYLYEFSIPWSDYPEDCYWIKIVTPIKVLISEPISLKEKHPNTLLFEYRNSRYHQDVVFETGIKFAFRCEGVIGPFEPGSSDVVYNDQKFNPYLLSSQPYADVPLKVGHQRGLPEWAIRIFNQIWSCNDVTIEGKSYAKTSDSKIDLVEQARYPMRAISFTVREGINRGSRVFSGDVNTNKKMMVAFGLDNKMFGDLSGGNPEIIPITNIE